MRLSGTKATAIHQYRGLGNQLWDLAGNRPSLDLRFADVRSESLPDSFDVDLLFHCVVTHGWGPCANDA